MSTKTRLISASCILLTGILIGFCLRSFLPPIYHALPDHDTLALNTHPQEPAAIAPAPTPSPPKPQSAAAAPEPDSSEIAELRPALLEAAGTIKALETATEEQRERIRWYEEVLAELTSGEPLAYEMLSPEVVYVAGSTADYYEHMKLLMRLGAVFSDRQRVTFWFDRTQAERYLAGKLQRNADDMLPPYDGMFGEIDVSSRRNLEQRRHPLCVSGLRRVAVQPFQYRHHRRRRGGRCIPSTSRTIKPTALT